MRFSSFVRRERLKKNMLIRELAKASECNPSYISLVERGLKQPRICNAIKIARALDLDVGIFKDIDEKFSFGGFVKKRYKNG